MLKVDLQSVVKKVVMYLQQSEEFKDVVVEVIEDEDTTALLELPNHHMYIAIQEVVEEVGIAKREVSRIIYTPGYWKTHYSYMEPPEPVEVDLSDHYYLSEACIEMVSTMFRARLENMVEYTEEDEILEDVI